MNIKLRAAAAVGLLVALPIGALALAGMGALVTVRLWAGGSILGAALVAFGVCALACLIGASAAAGLLASSTPAEAIRLTETDAPALWDEVRALTAALGVRDPDEIWLIADARVSVSETPALLGLWPGTRRLLLGAPLLMAFDVGQVRAVLAHEFGHYRRADVPLGGLTYRGYDAITRTMGMLGPRHPSGWLLRGLLRLYAPLSLEVRRQQEITADQAMARVAGPAAAVRTLRERPAIVAAWRYYLDNHVCLAWHREYAPAGIIASFGELVTAQGVELDGLPGRVLVEQRSRWDPHPPLVDRIAALESWPRPDGGLSALADFPPAPAWALLPDVETLCDQLDRLSFDLEGRTLLPVHRYTAMAATANVQQDADVLYAAAAQLAGVAHAGLGEVWDLLAAGRLSELAAVVGNADWGDHLARKRAVNLLAELLIAAIAATAVRSGAATWEHSWIHPPRLIDLSGAQLRLRDLVWQAILEKDAVPGVRAQLARYTVGDQTAPTPDAVRLREQAR